ncbi:MAG: endonuclease/exonuclease/phosphatase family protein [Candidatus Omnitrophica bacterium]|nr:endonuclease/exonuclease/phosphatase family protein [Candidatus Omnitrophota bacterium]
MKVIKLLVWLFSVLYLIMLCILCTIPYWPTALWWLANIFLMAPLWVLYFPVGFLFITGLLVKRKGVIIVHSLSFLIITFCIMKFNIPFSILSQKNEQSCTNLRIMTFNIGENLNATSLCDFISRTRPDIIALQEVYWQDQNALKEILPQNQWYLSFQGSLGIASRLKIKNAVVKNIQKLDGDGGLVGKYELEGVMGPIHFFNVHLVTPRKGLAAFMDNRVRGLSKMRSVTKLQAKDSAIMSRWISSYKTVLVGGDFNMSEINPIYKKYWPSLTNTFSKAGFGFGYTKYTSWHGVRIDHLLCDGNWKVIRCQVGPDIGSDHRPVVADVKLIGRNPTVVSEEESRKRLANDNTMFIFDNLKPSPGKFENSGTVDTTVNTKIISPHRNAQKVKFKASGAERVYNIIQLDLWNLENYPIVSFAYMISEGVPFKIRVKTLYNDWIDLRDIHLINDGKWHEMYIDVRAIVKNVLPSLKYLKVFQFYIHEDRYQKDTLWIDDFYIGDGTELKESQWAKEPMANFRC